MKPLIFISKIVFSVLRSITLNCFLIIYNYFQILLIIKIKFIIVKTIVIKQKGLSVPFGFTVLTYFLHTIITKTFWRRRSH